MAQLLIRGIRPETLARWKDRAKRHNRSLEAEIRELIESNAGLDPMLREDVLRFANEMRKSLAGKIKGDSTTIIRQARNSR